MTLYSPFTAALEKVRLLFQRRNGDAMPAVLGDKDGAGARTDIPDMKGFVYCRFHNVPDANNFATYGAPMAVRSGTAAYPNYPGAEVYVAYNYAGELEIVGANNRAMDKAGIDTRLFNPANQQSKWVYLWQLTIGLCSAVANSVNDSYLITVKKFRHYVNNTFTTFQTGAQAEKESLASVNPASDMHRYAAAWLDTYLNVLEITTSTTQSLFTPLDSTDIQELVNERPPDAVPLKAFYLANNQGSVTQQAAKDVDLRQFMNMPAVHGFPNPVNYRERIHPDKQAVYHGTLTVNATLTVLGKVSVLGDPAEGGGSDGGMTDFIVAAETGTPATIGDGETVTLAGDIHNIETSISGNIITHSLKQAAIVKVCDLRMTTDITLPYIATITDATELLCAPIKSGMVALPVSGIWRYFEVAGITTPIEAANTETGDVTNGVNAITNIPFTRSLAPGMTVSGTGIPAAATISTVDSPTQITVSHTPTATNAGVTLTFKFPADTTYDVFLVYDSGLATVVPFYRKWQMTSLASAKTQVDGVWLSDADTDARWIGAIRVPTNQLFQKNILQCFVSHLDHPFPHPLSVTDTTNSWSYTTVAYRQARATTSNKVDFITCDWHFAFSFTLVAYNSTTSATGFYGIGHNDTTAPHANCRGKQGGSNSTILPGIVTLDGTSSAGINGIYWLEKGGTGVLFYGDNNTDMSSGLSGWVMA